MNELEKAAKEYASCDITEGGLTGLCGMDASKYEPFIAGAKWQAKQSPWISVEERLPIERFDKEVSSSALSELVFIRAWSCGHELIGACKRENGKWADPFPGIQKDSYTITHWMPIPE